MNIDIISQQPLTCIGLNSIEDTAALPQGDIVDIRFPIWHLLGGSWQKFEDGIIIEKLNGGLSNHLYKCTLSDDVKTSEHEPRRVLVRIYGEIIREDHNMALTDAIVFALLAEKRIGPQLFGVFPDGRIEEFVESRPLLREELRDPDICRRTATILGNFHKLQMPVSKSPDHQFRRVSRYLEQLKEDHEKLSERVRSYVNARDLKSEINWLRSVFFDNEDSFPVVFCHNDFQENNILRVDSESDPLGFSLTPIDFEYCSYGFRAFDIGNHFNEWCFDNLAPDWPGYAYYAKDYPSKEEQMNFWKTYLRAYNADNAASVVSESEEFSPEKEAALEKEGLYGAALSHLFWGIWSFLQSFKSDIQFGYTEYAIARMNAYYKLKEKLPTLN